MPLPASSQCCDSIHRYSRSTNHSQARFQTKVRFFYLCRLDYANFSNFFKNFFQLFQYFKIFFSFFKNLKNSRKWKKNKRTQSLHPVFPATSNILIGHPVLCFRAFSSFRHQSVSGQIYKIFHLAIERRYSPVPYSFTDRNTNKHRRKEFSHVSL